MTSNFITPYHPDLPNSYQAGFGQEAFTFVLNQQALQALDKHDYKTLISLIQANFSLSSLRPAIERRFGALFLEVVTKAVDSPDYEKLAKELVKAGVSLTARNSQQETVLHLLLQKRKLSLFNLIMHEAVKTKDLGDLILARDSQGRVPLSYLNSYQDILCIALSHNEHPLNLLPRAILFGCPDSLLSNEIEKRTKEELEQHLSQESSPLYAACHARREAIACQILEKGVCDSVTKDGSSLSKAIKYGLWNVVEMLVVDAQPDTISARDADGLTALLNACRQEREDVILDLLEKVSATDVSVRELFQEAEALRNMAIFEKLEALATDEDLFGVNGIGMHLYERASEQHHEALALRVGKRGVGKKFSRQQLECLYNLANHHRSPMHYTTFVSLCPSNILTNRDLKLETNLIRSQMGLACFDYATRNGHKELASLLLSKEIFNNLLHVHTRNVVEAIKQATLQGWDDLALQMVGSLPQSFITQPDPEGRTPLFFACELGFEKLALLLLDRGAKDVGGKHGSAVAQAIEHDLGTVAARMIATSDKEQLIHSSEKGETALFVACRKKKEQLALAIIEKIKDKLLQPAREFAPALQNNLNTVIDKLIDLPAAFLLTVPYDGKNMLYVACEGKREDLALRLLQRGAKDRVTVHGTALMVAMRHGLHQIIDKILALPDNTALSGGDSDETCPLLVACDLGNEDLALRLLQKGAKDRTNKKGVSALSYSIEKGLSKVLNKLEEAVNFAAYGGAHIGAHLLVCLKSNREDLALRIVQSLKLETCEGAENALVDALKKDSASKLCQYLLSNVSQLTLRNTFVQLCTAKEKELALRLVAFGAQAQFSDVTEPLNVSILQDLDDVSQAIIAVYPLQAISCCERADSSPLYHACVRNKASLASKLLDKGFENKLPGGNQLLARGFENFQDSVLLERIVDVTSDANIISSSRALVLACLMRHESLALKLIERKAKDRVAKHGTALMAALDQECYKVVEKLLESTTEEIVNHKDESGQTALSIAFKNSRCDVAATLLQKGAKNDDEGAFAQVLYQAARANVEQELFDQLLADTADDDCCQEAFLLAAGTDEAAALKLFDKVQLSQKEIAEALVKAISCKFINLREKLLQMAKSEALNTKVTEEFASTPLFAALYQGDENLAIELVKRGAKNYAEDADGNTPLHLICTHGFYKVISAMLEANAIPDINGVNKANEVPLQLLMIRSNDDGRHQEEMILSMLKSGAALHLAALNDGMMSKCALQGIQRYLKAQLAEFPSLVACIEAQSESLSSLIDMLYHQSPEELIKQQKEKKLAPAIKIPMLLGDKVLLTRMAPHTTVGEFFNVLRTSFLEVDTPQHRSLILSIFKENTASRKKGVIVAKFPEAPKRVYLFQLPNQAKTYFPGDNHKARMIARLVNTIRENQQITATPRDAQQRKAFYAEVATGLKLVMHRLTQENNAEKWKMFIDEVAKAGTACGIRYEQVANEQFISHCLGMGSSKPEDKVYNSLSLLRYRLLQASAEGRIGNTEVKQDVHLVRDLLLALAEELGIACHGVNKTVKDNYTFLPANEAARQAKLEEYKKKFNDGYTLENICDNFLLYPDYQQDCISYLNDNPPEYWSNEAIERVAQKVFSMKQEEKGDEEIKAALRVMGYPYPPDWSLEKILKQIRFDVWATGYTDSKEVDHSYLYEVKALKDIDASTSQNLRFVTILEVLYALSIAESTLKQDLL